MRGYKMKFEAAQVVCDFGEGNGTLRINPGELMSISVDAGMDDTKICIVSQRRGVHIYTLKECSSFDIATMLYDLIKIGRPEKLHLDRNGAGIVVKDKLIPMLSGEELLLTKAGDVIYDIDEDQKRFRSN